MNETRAKRAAALEEKKRRLEELKARRSTRSVASSVSSAVSASKTGNLDDYIDGLLNSAPPGKTSVSIAPQTPSNAGEATSSASSVASTLVQTPAKSLSKIDQMNQKVLAVTPIASSASREVVKKVETFTICTQTMEEDFPLPLDTQQKDTEGENAGAETEQPMEKDEKNGSSTGEEKEIRQEPSLLTEEQINVTYSSAPFSSFFNSASKKVERLLGAPLLSDLLVDDMIYYADKDSKRDASTSTRDRKHSLVSAQATFCLPKWTANRDITSLDWSPHHRGELMLASYHMPSSSSTKYSPGSIAVSAVAPHGTSSASLLPRSKTELTGADGLTIVWNLAMPTRPEHIFTCGSPVLNANFHPTEGSLVVGACYSGQVVVWDVRNGRLPVQRSRMNILGNNSGAMGHVHPVVGLETLDSGFVTAASDGTVNFWSLENLMEPSETLTIPGANISSLAVAPESKTLLVGDERGSIHAIIPSATTGGRSSSSKRTVVKLHSSTGNNGQDYAGHYGNVTGLTTKSSLKMDSSVAMSKGFARGVQGLVVSCGVDWTTKLWAPAYTEKPLLNLLSHSYDYMSDVQWSPVHPSIFATASSSGTLGLWNLESSFDEPLTGLQGLRLDKNDNKPDQPSHGINKIKWSMDGRRIAAACSDTLYVLGMSEELWKPKGNEGIKLMNNLRSRGLLDTGER